MLNPICCPRNQVIFRDYEFDHLLEVTQRKDEKMLGLKNQRNQSLNFHFQTVCPNMIIRE